MRSQSVYVAVAFALFMIAGLVLVLLLARQNDTFVHSEYPNFTLSKSGSQIFIDQTGVVVRYTITVGNTGAIDIPDILIRDVLQTRPITVVNISSGGVFNGINTINWNIPLLSSNSAINLTYDAVYPPEYFGQSVRNSVVLAVDEDRDGQIDNNEISTTVNNDEVLGNLVASSPVSSTSSAQAPIITTSSARRRSPPPYNLK